jgi:peptidoglycan/LPS O-acetylase OafA/YrhL
MSHLCEPPKTSSEPALTDAWNPRRPEGNNFDFLRFFLAAVVLCNHSFQAVHGTTGLYRLEWIGRLTRGQALAGELAVDAFFVISGFLITQSWLSNPSLGAFLWKRALRIYPAFLVVAIACLLVFGPLAADDGRRYLSDRSWWDDYALRVLALKRIDLQGVLSGVPYPGMLNASTWTIRYEFWCYLAVALTGLMGILRRRSAVLALFALCWALSASARHWPDPFPTTDFICFDLIPVPISQRWLGLASFFLAGVTFHLYRDRIARSRLYCGLSVGMLLLCAATGKGLAAALPLFGTYVLFYAAFSQRPRLQKFGRRGDLSYGLYLYAYPVQQLLMLYAGRSLNAYSLSAIAFPIACALAWLSWRYVEAPCLRLKPRLARPQSGQEPPACPPGRP